MSGFLIHNIPTIILLIALIISWKCEVVGGVIFTLAGVFYSVLVLINSMSNGFEYYHLFWILQISGISILIGVLFLIDWKKEKKTLCKK
jgi:general stress protein CsbA